MIVYGCCSMKNWMKNCQQLVILNWCCLWTAPNQMQFMYAPVYCSCAIVNHWSDMRSHDSQNWFDDTINNIDCEARLDRWCQHFGQIRSTRCQLCQFPSEPKLKKTSGNCFKDLNYIYDSESYSWKLELSDICRR